jgi:hypothetical protein
MTLLIKILLFTREPIWGLEEIYTRGRSFAGGFAGNGAFMSDMESSLGIGRRGRCRWLLEKSGPGLGGFLRLFLGLFL